MFKRFAIVLALLAAVLVPALKANATTSDMSYHGGNVQTTPAVYVSWWGPQWANGFTMCSNRFQVLFLGVIQNCYTSEQAQTYATDFLRNVGGSGWESTVTQYCKGVPVGTVNCGSAGQHITNPTGQLRGTWNDPTPAPSSPTNADVQAAAWRLANHFGGNNPNATYFVLPPAGTSGLNGSPCGAYHSNVNGLVYAFVSAPPGCQANSVNTNDDAYGHGFFDGYSISLSHEMGEAITDPAPGSGWWDSSANYYDEIGDLCGHPANTTLANGQYYAINPLWSNASGSCVS